MSTGSEAAPREAAKEANRSARPGSGGSGGGRKKGKGKGKGRGSAGKGSAGKGSAGKGRTVDKGLAGAVVGGSGKVTSAASGKTADAVKKARRARPPVTPLGARRRMWDAAGRRAKGLANRGFNGATNTVGRTGNRAQQAGAAAGAKGDKSKPDALDPLSTSGKVAGGGAAAKGGGKAVGTAARSTVLAARAGRTGLRWTKRTIRTIYRLIPLPPFVKAAVVAVIVAVMVLVIFVIAVLDGLAQENTGWWDDRGLAELYGLGENPTVDDVVANTDIPRDAADAYLSAAETYDVDWWVLAGVGYVECTNGTYAGQGCNPDITWDEAAAMRDGVRVCEAGPGDHPAPNTSGARGPMQMTGNTWSGDHCQGDTDVSRDPIPDGEENDGVGYASDGDGDGVADPWSFEDAAHGTARLLLHRGDGDIWHGVHRYNPGAGSSADDSWYVDDVREAAEGYRDAVPVTPVVGGGYTEFDGECPAGFPRARDVEMDLEGTTPAMRGVAGAVQQCFGGPPGGPGNCYGRYGDINDPSDDAKYEHPRGRACDFMVCSGCAPGTGTSAREWGDTAANWLVANGEAMNIFQVIWYDQIWWIGRSTDWEPYSCNGGNTACHRDHIHVSVSLMPGDPPYASCVPGIPCTE